MSETSKKHVVVVGCGIVGVSTAIWLQRHGQQVTLVDRTGPAAGTAYGNAGILAACSVIPVTVPGILKKAPGMLMDRFSPLFMRWSYLPSLLPWLYRYLGHANLDENRRIAQALYPLLNDSLKQHQDLSEGTEASSFVHPDYYLFGFRDRSGYDNEKPLWDIRRDLGFNWEELGVEELRSILPEIKQEINFGIRFDQHGRISDPGRYVKSLAKHAYQNGANSLTGEATDVVADNGKVTGVVIDGQKVDCDAMVVATGAWSGPLTSKLGFKVPLETERGYHIELVNPSHMPAHPIMIASGKFVITPMEGRIRCAGIVEFGGLEAEASENPIKLLKQQVNNLMPDVRYDHIDEWMGHRPAPEDSIPYVGEVPGYQGAYLGFGHHHVGLTGGPKTGRILAELISNDSSQVDLTPYRVLR